MSVKGRYAVLLTKNSDFIKVKNKNYSVGDEVKIPQYKGQILAAAASFIVVCGGTQVSDEMAKGSGLDAGFGRGTKGIQVASFLVHRHRELKRG